MWRVAAARIENRTEKPRGWAREGAQDFGWRGEERVSERDKGDAEGKPQQAPVEMLLLECNWRRCKPGEEIKGRRFREIVPWISRLALRTFANGVISRYLAGGQ